MLLHSSIFGALGFGVFLRRKHTTPPAATSLPSTSTAWACRQRMRKSDQFSRIDIQRAMASITAVIWKVPTVEGVFGRRVRGRSTAGVITFRTALLVRKVVGLAAEKKNSFLARCCLV